MKKQKQPAAQKDSGIQLDPETKMAIRNFVNTCILFGQNPLEEFDRIKMRLRQSKKK